MNLKAIDWIIVGVFGLLLLSSGYLCRRYVKGVADYCVAGRNMRKFLGLSTWTAEGLGLISIAICCQEGFTKGFCYIWVSLCGLLTAIIVFGIFGFAIMRYRDTKVLTVSQYFEIRYTKGVRFLAGLVISFSGVLNMAIFPIVGCQFIKYFIGLQPEVMVFGITMRSEVLLMTSMIAVALFFTYIGGMVSVILTDFVQSIIIAFAVISVSFVLVHKIGLQPIHESLQNNLGATGYNPLAEGSYGIYWVISIIIGAVLGFVSFSPNMQRVASADSAKTARLMTLISMIFGNGRTILLLGWGMAALAIKGLTVPDGQTTETWSRMVTPIFLGQTVPSILKGFLLAGLIAAFISTVDSYFLCWSTAITNDVICVNLKKHLSTKQHLKLFRIVVAFVALFIWLFGVLYRPTESILAFSVLTGVMFQGVGIAMIGGMYWKRGTVAGAYWAISLMCIVPLLDLIFRRVFEGSYKMNVGYVMFGTICASIIAYIIVSLLTNKGRIKNV